jgi:hypothetical protein|tara:strand:- start:4584 stop:4898 length:315 start_codon:yes stop_codon:yes gene_type:complete
MSNNINEGEYLEMVAQLKQKFDEVEKKEKQTEVKILKLKRDLSMIYGLVRSMDSTIVGGVDLPDEFTAVWDLLSSTTMDVAEVNLFSGNIEELDYEFNIDINVQ